MRCVSKSLQSILLASTFSIVALPALAASCNPLSIVDSLELQTLRNGIPTVSAKIAGAPKTMVVDTGAYSSAVTKKTADDLGLTEMRNPGRRGVRFTNGATSDLLVRLPTLELGTRLRQDNALFYVDPNSNGNLAGFLGGEFLEQYDADFDFAAHRLNLFSPDHCAGKEVYWQAPAVAVVPFTLDGNHIKLRVQVDGKRLDALIDTGAANTTLNLTTAQRILGVDVNAPDVEKVGSIQGGANIRSQQGPGYTADVYRKRFKTLAFEGVTINEPAINLLPDLAKPGPRTVATGSLIRGANAVSTTAGVLDVESGLPELLLGMSTLNQLHLYIAYKQRKLYISASATPPPQQPAQAAPEPTTQPAQTAQTASDSFCPSPTDNPAMTPASSPSTDAGMAAFRERNFQVAYSNLRPLADSGNMEAARDIGIVLRQSCGKADKASAAAWLLKAANASDKPAAAQLGDMYEFGDGITKDGAAAFKWLAVAAGAGIRPAQVDLGELYFSGFGVPQDRYQGLVWSVKAGEDGAPIALFHIGREYANGQALPKDPAKAVLYMTAGIQRLPPGRRAEFQPGLDNVSKQISGSALNQAKENGQKWMPGQGSLSAVMADADKKRGH